MWNSGNSVYYIESLGIYPYITLLFLLISMEFPKYSINMGRFEPFLMDFPAKLLINRPVIINIHLILANFLYDPLSELKIYNRIINNNRNNNIGILIFLLTINFLFFIFIFFVSAINLLGDLILETIIILVKINPLL